MVLLRADRGVLMLSATRRCAPAWPTVALAAVAKVVFDEEESHSLSEVEAAARVGQDNFTAPVLVKAHVTAPSKYWMAYSTPSACSARRRACSHRVGVEGRDGAPWRRCVQVREPQRSASASKDARPVGCQMLFEAGPLLALDIILKVS